MIDLLLAVGAAGGALARAPALLGGDDGLGTDLLEAAVVALAVWLVYLAMVALPRTLVEMDRAAEVRAERSRAGFRPRRADRGIEAARAALSERSREAISR